MMDFRHIAARFFLSRALLQAARRTASSLDCGKFRFLPLTTYPYQVYDNAIKNTRQGYLEFPVDHEF